MRSDDSKFRYGILGCGAAAARLVIPALKDCGRAELAFVASRDPKRAQAYAERFGCGHASSYEALLRMEEIDIVYVALPIRLHGEWTQRALKAGKHVHCEKSLAPSLGEVDQILECARENERRVLEGFMYRFHSLFQRVRQVVRSGEIGALKSYVGSFGFSLPAGDSLRRDPQMGMGILNEVGCYPVSAARLFFDSEPLSVVCHLGYESGVDFSGSATLEFASGGSAYCAFGYDRSYRCSYSLWGTKGHVSVDRAFTTPPTLEPLVHVERMGRSEELKLPAENHFSKMIDAFCIEIQSDSGRGHFEEEALRQAKVMEALRLSARQGGKVDLKDVIPVCASQRGLRGSL
ncbi:MAG: Gfo/Idh/MocA family oxidoreductase [Candidatus Omnitrophica bacterium]|nr:Gfo/Idh/MocA family oxidoreductase [Candidatus Omnitrophota bacterium]